MRNASAALVPLLLAVMLIFWFAAFMGSENDNAHAINDVTNLQKLQEKLLISAAKQRFTLKAASKEQDLDLSDEQVNDRVDQYIKYIMVSNKIEH